MNQRPTQIAFWSVFGEEIAEKRFDFWRIVGIRADGTDRPIAVALIQLRQRAHKKAPMVMAFAEFERLVSTGRWSRSSHDPCIPRIREPEDITNSARRALYMELMNSRYAMIKPLVRAGWDAFIPERRSALIQSARKYQERDAQGTVIQRLHSEAWIRKLLYTYWEFGGSAYALVPGVVNNGPLSREARIKTAAQEKKEPTFLGKKTGPHSRDLGRRPDLGPYIDPPLYEKVKGAILATLKNPDLKYSLAHAYNRRRAIPWSTLRSAVNELVGPKEIRLDETGFVRGIVEGARLLTREQVKQVGRSILHVGDFVLAVKDWKSIALDHRPPIGDVRDAVDRSGKKYAVDVLTCDVFPTHNTTRLLLPRIYLAAVVDVYSRMIAAIYVWAGEPDYRMISYALAAAAMPKSEWGAIIGETFDDSMWPCQGLPEMVDCDNGEAARKCGARLPDLVFDVVPHPPHLAYLNQAVETSFHLLDVGLVKWYPASTKGPRARHSENRQLKAIGSVLEIMRQANRWACHVANFRPLDNYPDDPTLIREGVKLRPIDLWHHGCRAEGGVLRPFVQERHFPALLQSEDLRITQYGIDLDGLYFDFPDKERPDWFQRLKVAATAGPAHTIRCHFDHALPRCIYLIPKDPSLPTVNVPLSRLSRQWEGFSRAEVKASEEMRKGQAPAIVHEFDVRKTAIGRSVAADVANAKGDIKEQYGSVKKRNEVAAAVGQDAVRDAQKKADAERDQALHPPCHTPPQQRPAPEASATYEQLMGVG